MITTRTDEKVIRSAQSGDMVALSTIYDVHRRRVYNLCFRMLRDCSDAEDLTQDVFVQVFRKIGTFRGQSAFSTWLHRLAVNMVLMEIRSRKTGKYNLIPLEMENDEDDGTHEQFGREDDDLRSSVDRVTLESALAALPPGYRIVFLLHDVHGYEHQEIAEILCCSIGNCKSQLHKARLKLRKLLTHRMGHEEFAMAA